jgi:hypothetical protein
MTWDVTTPSGADDVRQGDDYLRELKTDLQTALTSHGRFPVAAGSPEFHYLGDRGATASRPTNGEGGLYSDTDTNEFLRDNGTTWDLIGVNIATGIKAVFYQAAAPTGWTVVSSLNDRLLYVNGAGGSTGGAWNDIDVGAPSVGNHRHNVCEAVVSASGFRVAVKMYADTYGSGDAFTIGDDLTVDVTTIAGPQSYGACTSTGSISNGDNLRSSNPNSGWTTHDHTGTHDSSKHAYNKVIICSRD